MGFDQRVFLQFYYKNIMQSKIANFQVRSFENNLYHKKAYKKQHIRHHYGHPGFSSSFLAIAASKWESVRKWRQFPGQ